MPTIFSAVFPDELKMPVENVEILLDSYRERRKTGAVRLGYAFDKRLLFLFKRGEALNAYLFAPDKWEAMPPERGAEWLRSAGEAHAKSVPLSAFGLLIAKLLAQSQGAETEVFVRQAQLANHLAALQAKGEVALMHLAWKSARAAILFAPRGEPHFSFASQDVILDETGAYKSLCEWSDPECTATAFPPDLSIEAWQEYYLRSAFDHIYEASLARFETLTGRALVDSLTRLVNVFADRNNMEISVMARKLTDNEVFSSPAKAAYAYRLLMAELFDHFSGVVGPRLYISTMREIAANLSPRELETARSFGLLTKGIL